ncbi:hypothetical protein [Williamsia deligens]|uniref:Mce-associated membrane protein n=1 Tax=Williamsia deligens TaxID=321325 RepID=A0ABW3G3E1_9NOCA|nr:hypothetical protein [Williamsia deligens]MCP2194684.1 hypothetical protein [Williamsia deligens]
MSVVRRAVTLWVDVLGVTVSAVLVAAMAGVVGTPAWWVSLTVTTVVIAVATVIVARAAWPGTADRRRGAGTAALDGDRVAVILALVVCAGLLAAGVGFVAVAADARADARARVDARTEVAQTGAAMVCRVIERGTPARQAAAEASATGDLADRLRTGATVLGTDVSSATCRPVQTALTSSSTDAAEVLVLVDVTADGDTVGQAVAAGLRRVDGRWRVASLQVLR